MSDQVMIESKQAAFMDIVHELSAGEKYYCLILDVAKDVEKYLSKGDPWDALDFFLMTYQAVPAVQEVMRQILSEALTKTLELEK